MCNENLIHSSDSTAEEKLPSLLKLKQFHGTTQWYRHLSGMIYTDGIQYLAQTWECYWLIDIVGSVLSLLKKRSESYKYIVKFYTYLDDTALVQIEDGNGKTIYQQKIPYTDFRDKGVCVKLYLGLADKDGTYCLFLPSEN